MTKRDVPARAKGIQADEVAINATVDMSLAEHRDHKPTMLKNVFAGKLTEIDAQSGALAVEAKGAGVEAAGDCCTLAFGETVGNGTGRIISGNTKKSL